MSTSVYCTSADRQRCLTITAALSTNSLPTVWAPCPACDLVAISADE